MNHKALPYPAKTIQDYVTHHHKLTIFQLFQKLMNNLHTCASWIFIEFPLALASDNFPFQTLLSPLYSYLLSRKLEQDQKKCDLVKRKCNSGTHRRTPKDFPFEYYKFRIYSITKF